MLWVNLEFEYWLSRGQLSFMAVNGRCDLRWVNDWSGRLLTRGNIMTFRAGDAEGLKGRG